jgi:hypothetical protein
MIKIHAFHTLLRSVEVFQVEIDSDHMFTQPRERRKHAARATPNLEGTAKTVPLPGI